MKKLVKVTALLLVAAAMFAGCKNNVEEEPANEVALFSKDDVSIAIAGTDINLTDGNWAYAYKLESNYHESESSHSPAGTWEMSIFEKAELTVANGSTTFTYLYDKGYEKLTADRDLTEEEISNFTADGATVDGRVVKMEIDQEYPAAALSQLTLQEQLGMLKYFTLKTNEEHTKYFVEHSESEDGESGTIEFYMMKK